MTASTPTRKVPLHLRQRAKLADQFTERLAGENLSRLQAASQPPPPPNTQIVDSRPVVLPREEPPEASVHNPDPAATHPPTVPPQPAAAVVDPATLYPSAGVPTFNADFDALRAENERLANVASRAQSAQSAEAARAARLDRELNALRGTAEDTARRLATLEAENESRASAVVDDASLAARFTPEQRKLLGDEQCRSMIATARAEASAVVRRELKTSLAPIEERSRQTAAQTHAQRRVAIFAAMDNNQSIAGWRTVDLDPDFKSWLGTVHPLTRRTYKEMLYSNFDLPDVAEAAAACSEIYKAYQATRPAAARPRTLPSPMPATHPPATGAPPQAPANLITPTQQRAMVQEMRVTRDPKRRKEIQDQLDSAQRDGRISR